MTKQMILFRERMAFYWENHTKHIDTLSEYNAGFWYVKAGGTNSNSLALMNGWNGRRLLSSYHLQEYIQTFSRESWREETTWGA
jgi:hypothetical protein